MSVYCRSNDRIKLYVHLGETSFHFNLSIYLPVEAIDQNYSSSSLFYFVTNHANLSKIRASIVMTVGQ